MATISRKLVSGVGFSKGWAELAFRKPPPLLPSSLMTSWEAMGPRASVCCPPSRVETVAGASNVCGTPCQTRTRAKTKAMGSRTYRMPRVRSTQ